MSSIFKAVMQLDPGAEARIVSCEGYVGSNCAQRGLRDTESYFIASGLNWPKEQFFLYSIVNSTCFSGRLKTYLFSVTLCH